MAERAVATFVEIPVGRRVYVSAGIDCYGTVVANGGGFVIVRLDDGREVRASVLEIERM